MSSPENLNTIICTIARMNPPTPGHMSLITHMIKEAVKFNVPQIFLILSNVDDNNEDPMPCDKNPNAPDSNFKTEIIDSMVAKLQQKLGTNVSVICRCVPKIRGPTGNKLSIFSVLSDIIYKDFGDIPNLNLIMFVGDDRADLLDSVTNAYYLKKDNLGSMNGIATDRDENMTTYKKYSRAELENLNITEIPPDAFSASLVRKIVFYGLRNKFNDIYRPYLKPEQLDTLYNTLLKGQLLGPPPPESARPHIPEYTYPLMKTDPPISYDKQTRRDVYKAMNPVSSEDRRNRLAEYDRFVRDSVTEKGGSKKRKYKKRTTKKANKKTFRKRPRKTKRATNKNKTR